MFFNTSPEINDICTYGYTLRFGLLGQSGWRQGVVLPGLVAGASTGGILAHVFAHETLRTRPIEVVQDHALS